MYAREVETVVVAAASTVLMAWYSSGPKKSRRVVIDGGVQVGPGGSGAGQRSATCAEWPIRLPRRSGGRMLTRTAGRTCAFPRGPDALARPGS